MAEYSKKLHVRKNSVVTDIKLYTSVSDLGSSNYITLRDGSTPLYAKLGATNDTNASPLRVRKAGTTYSVLTAALAPPGSQTFYSNGTFTVPLGYSQITVTALGGGGGGYPSNAPLIIPLIPGCGGGGGGLITTTINVTPLATYAVTIGAGGSATTGTWGMTPVQGGTTSFDSILSAIGGYPGQVSSGGASGGNTNNGSKFSGATGGAGGTTPYSPYGDGGAGASVDPNAAPVPSPGSPGNQGLLIVSWG